MTKREISRRILNLLDCDADEIVDAIYKLAKEVEEDEWWENLDWSGMQGGL